jgi:nucleoredoxin
MTSTNTGTAETTSTTTAYQTIEDLLGPTLYIKQKKKTKSTTTSKDKDVSSSYTIESCTTQSVLTKNKKPVEYVLLYFSASWCPPCQSFTPILADFYQQYQNIMEIIYISSDRNVEEFEKYYLNKMPYSTIHPFDTKASDVTFTLRKKLPQVFDITGIPTLVVLHIPPEKGSGIRFVTDQGRVDLLNHPNKYDLVWKKWKSSPTPLLSIEEGVALAKKGDGSIYSMVMKLIQALLQNPIYIFGIYYIIKFYGKSVYKMVLSLSGANNSTITSDPSMFEPVPDDEF